MEGPLDTEMAAYGLWTLAGLLTGAGWFSIAASLGLAGYNMGLAHTTTRGGKGGVGKGFRHRFS